MRYAFGDYTLDIRLRELQCRGQLTKVQPKVFDLLVYLVQQRDHVVTKQELVDYLWPAQHISDATLSSCVKLARQAVGDSGRAQQCIQTLHGRGYRFTAEVTEQHNAPSEVESFSTSYVPVGFSQDHDDTALASTHSSSSQGTMLAAPPLVTPVDEERKLVTVLTCAFANAFLIAERLESEAWYALRQQVFALAQQEVQYYGGSIQQFGADGLLALFGTPIAYEDHAQRAALAAMSLHERLRQQSAILAPAQEQEVTVCSVLHTGQVIVGRIGTDRRLTAMTVGDTMQLADRLLCLAEPGTILASQATYLLVASTLRCERVEPSPAPNTTACPPVYKVLGMAAPTLAWQRGRVLSPFVGREREMAMLHGLLVQVEDGRGQLVSIVGEPGMGKSRLLYEFRRQLSGRRLTFWSGPCVSFGSTMPYLPLLSLLRQIWQITEADGAETVTTKIYQGLQHVDLPPETWAAYFLHLLGVETGTEHLSQLGPQARRTQTFEALLQLIFQTSKQTPLVLEWENLHWIDPTSEAWLALLAEHLAGTPVMLLASYRPGYRPLWMEKSYATQIALQRLSDDDGWRVIKAICQPMQVSNAVAHELLAKADGNPFFLEELIWTVRECGEHSATMLIPDTVQAVLAARIDRLPSEAKHLLQVASVIGKEVPLPLLQAVTPLSDAACAQALQQLLAAEFLHELSSSVRQIYGFKHTLTQEVTYQSLLQRTRQQVHERIVQSIGEHLPSIAETQPELLAYHCTQAGLVQEAVSFWRQAGQRAIERSAFVEAIAHLYRGLEMLTTLPESPDRTQQELHLLALLGAALVVTQGFAAPAVERTYARARALSQHSGEAPQRFPVLLGLLRFYGVRGDIQTALELGEQLLGLTQHVRDAASGVEAHHGLGVFWFLHGEVLRAHAHLTQSLALYTPEQHHAHTCLYGLNPGVSSLIYMAHVLWMRGYPRQALQQSEAALRLARQLSHPFSLVFTLSVAVRLHLLCRHQNVHALIREQITLAREQGFKYVLAQGLIYQGVTRTARRHKAAGLRQVLQGLTNYRATGAEVLLPYYLALLAATYRENSRPGEGLAALDEALAVMERTQERWYEAEIYRLKGLLHLRPCMAQAKTPAASLGQAETYFQQALEVARSQQAKSFELRAAMSLCRLWQQDKRDAASRLLAEVYGWFTEGFDTADLQEAKALLETFA